MFANEEDWAAGAAAVGLATSDSGSGSCSSSSSSSSTVAMVAVIGIVLLTIAIGSMIRISGGTQGKGGGVGDTRKKQGGDTSTLTWRGRQDNTSPVLTVEPLGVVGGQCMSQQI